MPFARRVGRSLLAVALVTSVLAFAWPAPGGRVEAAATTIVQCDDRAQTTVPVTPAMDSYTSITPQRLVDTRDGTGGHVGVVAEGCTLRLRLADSLVPTDARAAALSVTAIAKADGFLTVFSCADGRPLASSINGRTNIATPNLVVAVPDAQREVCIYSRQAADIVVDLQGWWGNGSSRFRPIAPIRAYDTRELAVPARLPADGTRNVALAGEFVPSDATAVVINLTATQTASVGWLLAYPCGETPPLASNVNYEAGDTRAGAAIVGLGTRNGGQGQICIRTKAAAHFIVDVVGYYADAPDFGPSNSLLPVQQRLVDTRDETGPWDTPFAAREIREIDPTVGLERAQDATAVVINAIGLGATTEGYLSVFPCSDVPPLVSTLNTFPGRDVSNLLTVELSDDGTICVLSNTSGDVVLDLVGIMVTPEGSPLQEITFRGPRVWPEFTVDGADYALECAAGLNDLTVAISSHRGRTIRIDGDVVADDGSSTFPLSADDILTVELGGSGVEPRTYHFRCLPADFPDLIVERPGEPEPGWYATGLGGTGDTEAFAVILDERGAPVWYQRTERWPINVKRLSDGSIMYDTQEKNGYGFLEDAVAEITSLDGTQRRTVRTDDPATFPIDHHDHIELDGGGWALISYPLIRDPSPSVPCSPTDLSNGAAVGGSIREVDAAFNPLWQWNIEEHFAIDQTQFPLCFKNHLPELGELDPYHINSIDRSAGGDYVVSARHLDAVFHIDRASGDVGWVLSSEPLVNNDGAPQLQILGDPFNGPRRPHDARFDEATNVLTMFDNRTSTGGEPARAVAYEIDEAAGTATLLWQIDEPSGRSSSSLGSVRVGPDGSRLVNWGGLLQPMFNEFDATGELMLSIEESPSGRAYRIVKYTPDAFDVESLRSGASST